MPAYDIHASKRPVNLSLNEDLVRSVRALSPNLSAQVEVLLAEFLVAEHDRRADADARLTLAAAEWNRFADLAGSFADEHSTL